MKEINKEEFKKEIEDYVKVLFRKTIKEADQQQLFQAVSYAVKDFIVDQWMATHKTYEEKDVRQDLQQQARFHLLVLSQCLRQDVLLSRFVIP